MHLIGAIGHAVWRLNTIALMLASMYKQKYLLMIEKMCTWRQQQLQQYVYIYYYENQYNAR